MNSAKLQILAYYLMSAVVLSVLASRGLQAGLHQTSSLGLILLISASFILCSWLRKKIEPVIVTDKDPLDQPKYQLMFDFLIFLLVATFVFCFEFFIYHHPLLISVKVFLWAIIIGYFASIDSALHRVRDGFSADNKIEITEEKPVSVTQKVNIFFSTTVLIAVIAVSISAFSYMGISSSSDTRSITSTQQDFIVDVLFILGIVVSLTTRIIFSYSLNIQHLFDNQTNILKQLRKGELNEYVPVVSRDEFGIIAQHTNKMIDQLKDKEKMQHTLERIVSPNIMNKLLSGTAKDLKQGEEYDIAILFCDLRKFTNYAENTPPEEVIFFLNAYFTKIADVVAEHDGIINKFMGDAILAVFGVEGEAGYVERAVETAWDIIMHSDSIIMRDGTKFEIGIGIHKGRAAAGTIGSAERYEYTFIGDAVNTASRLDGLTKRTNHKIIISDAVYSNLNRDTQARFTDLGKQMIRGKSAPIRVYGAAMKEPRQSDKIVKFKAKKSYRI